MVEWSITAVLKTVELRGSGGSNPSLSASSLENQEFTRITNKFTNNGKFVRIVLYWTLLDSKYKDLAKYHIIHESRRFGGRSTAENVNLPLPLCPLGQVFRHRSVSGEGECLAGRLVRKLGFRH